MADDGETKDDVKVPDGEVGEKIEKLFRTEEKDTSKLIQVVLETLLTATGRCYRPYLHGRGGRN